MEIPIKVAHLFRPLEAAFVQLLASLTVDDWSKPTAARHWVVKDVAAHLLDGNLRTLSMQRDGYFGETPPYIQGYEGLVAWLNQLNADWVKAGKRLSPAVLTLLHRATGESTCDFYESLDPMQEAIFAVAWAGEDKSLNWMHLAREYTEKWHHQQQIREAVNRPDVMNGIMTKELFYPVMDTFFRALPHTFRDMDLPVETKVLATVTGEIGGSWLLERQPKGWELTANGTAQQPDATVEIQPEVAWKLFSKNIRPHEIKEGLKITGNQQLASQVLNMVAVMA